MKKDIICYILGIVVIILISYILFDKLVISKKQTDKYYDCIMTVDKTNPIETNNYIIKINEDFSINNVEYIKKEKYEKEIYDGQKQWYKENDFEKEYDDNNLTIITRNKNFEQFEGTWAITYVDNLIEYGYTCELK